MPKVDDRQLSCSSCGAQGATYEKVTRRHGTWLSGIGLLLLSVCTPLAMFSLGRARARILALLGAARTRDDPARARRREAHPEDATADLRILPGTAAAVIERTGMHFVAGRTIGRNPEADAKRGAGSRAVRETPREWRRLIGR
jgi:hypothetical protein